MKLKIIFLLSLVLSIYSCKPREPKLKVTYSLITIRFVPDSLKDKQRLWVVEAIKSASQHMTGGDYEDVDETIDQARITSEDLFEVEELGLIKKIADVNYQDVQILYKNMTPYEKKVMDSLKNIK